MKSRIVSLVLSFCLMILPIYGGAETASADVTLEQGYSEMLEFYSTSVEWVKNGEEEIFGKFYFPLDYDPAKQYPVIIMSHGDSATHTVFEKSQWVNFVTGHDCIAYAFDFGGVSDLAHSTMDPLKTTINTEISDLNAVIDMVLTQPFVDSDEVFLMGQGFGGFISAITAPERDNDIRGMILLYPAINAASTVHEMFTSARKIPKEGAGLFGISHTDAYLKAIYYLDLENTLRRYYGDILIIHGENDSTVPISFSEDAVSRIYREGQAELLTVTGVQAVHDFDVLYEEGRTTAQESILGFLEAHMKPCQKIVCIGDSITVGMLRNGKGYTQLDNFPWKLNDLLGPDWKVYNYGLGGAYATRDEGTLSYWNLEQFTDSLTKDASVYTIMLGTNDSVHWDAEAYRDSLSALVDVYQTAHPDSRILLMISPAAYPDPLTSNIRADILDEEIPPVVTEIAQEKGVDLIDMHAFTTGHPEWFADGVHPNGEGHRNIAEFLYEHIQSLLNQ